MYTLVIYNALPQYPKNTLTRSTPRRLCAPSIPCDDNESCIDLMCGICARWQLCQDVFTHVAALSRTTARHACMFACSALTGASKISVISQSTICSPLSEHPFPTSTAKAVKASATMTTEKPGTGSRTAEEAAHAPDEAPSGDEPEQPASSHDTEDTEVSDTESASSVTEPENWIRISFGPDWAFCLWTQRGARWNIRGQSEAIDAWRGLNLKKVFRVTWTVDGGWIMTGETKESAPVVAYWHVKCGTIAVENAKRWTERH